MTKDELLKLAKEEHNVTLNPKEKLADLEDKVATLEANKDVKEVKAPKKKETVSKDPVASRSEHGKVVPWNPRHRSEFWQFVYDKKNLTEEEIKTLGL
jgi:hypothetical protein|tara:strand:- start:1377 stop:1670 length:294 start_codon:yes stop_codon:yes gene_type:complete